MDPLITLLKAAALVGALFCVGAYVYGYVLRPKGTRRLHVASLLFSGLALFSVLGLMPKVVTPASAVAGTTLVVFLLLSVVLQAATAFRGRAADRRADARAPVAAAVREPNEGAVLQS
jgi:hypothetical protein